MWIIPRIDHLKVSHVAAGFHSSQAEHIGPHHFFLKRANLISAKLKWKPATFLVFSICCCKTCQWRPVCALWSNAGDQVAVYSELSYPTALRGVAFHPHEHLVAFCAFGQNQLIQLYVYDRKGEFICLQVIMKEKKGFISFTLWELLFSGLIMSINTLSTTVQTLLVSWT